MENKNTVVSAGRVEFELVSAEHFPVPKIVDRIYFFNPFSIEILQKVIARILDSYYENPRTMQLFFNYSSDEYISYLMTVDELIFLRPFYLSFLGENESFFIYVQFPI